MNEYELLRVTDFVERTRAPFRELMPIADEEPIWNITSHLIRSEIRGRLVTISSLAQAAGTPYATARRTINRMLDRNLIERRSRGRTGKSHSLHPSATLIAAFERYARATKSLLADTMGMRPPSDDEGDYYFGGAPMLPDESGHNLLARRSDEAPVRFLCADDNYFLALRNMWADLRANLASTRDFDLRPLPTLYDEIRANAERPQSRYDIVTVNMPWLAGLAAEGILLPLDRLIERHGLNLGHFHPAILKRAVCADETFGVPIYTTIAILAARRDLFEDAGLAFPKTFDDVIATGRRFHHPAQGRYGVVWDGAEGMPIASSFLFFLGAASLAPLDGANELAALLHRVAAHGKTALDFMHRLLEIAPSDALSKAWDQNLALFIEGRAALAYCWTMRAARMEYDVHSTVKRRVEYLPQPAGPRGNRTSPIGGFMLAIPANLPPERIDIAVKAIGWMTSDTAMRAHVRNGFPIAPRFVTSAEPEAIAGSPIVRFVDTLAHRQMLSTWQRPHIPSYRAIERAIGTHVYAALRRTQSDGQAIRSICDAIEREIAVDTPV